MTLIKNKAKTTIKNYLVAIVVALQHDEDYEAAHKKYYAKMLELQNEVLDNYDNQEKNEKQEKNWIEHKDILKLLKKITRYNQNPY